MDIPARFLIALPTFNEIESIEEMVRRIQALGYDLIVVDGASTDGTVDRANALGAEVVQRAEFGPGYGGGIRKAMQVAEERGYDYLGFLDCDTTYPPEDFEKLLACVPEYDLVVGARPMRLVRSWRKVGNLLHSWATSLLFARRVRDVNSGMRLVRVGLFRPYMTATHMGMVAQMTCFALRNRLKFVEVTIGYGDRKGASTVKLTDGWVILRRIISERFRRKINLK